MLSKQEKNKSESRSAGSRTVIHLEHVQLGERNRLWQHLNFISATELNVYDLADYIR